MATSVREEKHQTKNFQKDDDFDIHQQSTDNYSSCSTTCEDEQTTLDDMEDKSWFSSNIQSLDDLGLPADNSQSSAIADIDSDSSQSSSPTISKIIFVSHLPITLKCCHLRTFFPGCPSCVFCDLHIGRIPGSTTTDELWKLFPEAASIEYKQGKSTHDRIKLGYAFVHFVDMQLAAEVMQFAGQYRIHNEPLLISYKRLK
ncbi:unnamed protein product [Adineta steineri]|uniref:RRM domain-containing protein n=1 Tax=Adineta steineri TaxID=433720 RepID=A0A820DVG7_9BILA|nr:unnamed protein product [Adineta steineri]CAF4211215.1 unnamed protein product [Adineta steineri]CAF4237400.1 unnamed protein product [Adineta steineri]